MSVCVMCCVLRDSATKWMWLWRRKRIKGKSVWHLLRCHCFFSVSRSAFISISHIRSDCNFPSLPPLHLPSPWTTTYYCGIWCWVLVIAWGQSARHGYHIDLATVTTSITQHHPYQLWYEVVRAIPFRGWIFYEMQVKQLSTTLWLCTMYSVQCTQTVHSLCTEAGEPIRVVRCTENVNRSSTYSKCAFAHQKGRKCLRFDLNLTHKCLLQLTVLSLSPFIRSIRIVRML